MTYLEDYYQLIKSGDIVAGYWIKREIENLIRDLENPKYYYDTTKAHKRIAFMQTHCLQSQMPYYGKPIELMPWELMAEEVLYSFFMSDTGMRRFIEFLLLIARKNGKTTFFGADATTDLFIGEGGGRLCSASNDDQQARYIWEETNSMRKSRDPHNRITSNNLTTIRNDVKNIKMFRMSSLTRFKDGKVISKAYVDEAHDIDEENGNSELAEAITRSMSSQDDPFFATCTTQGFSREGCYLDKKIAKAQNIIEGKEDDDRFFPLLYMQDSEQEIWQDEASWEKSNPSLRYGVKKIEKLRRDVENAKTDKATRIHLLTKDFNIKSNKAEAWLSINSITYQQEKQHLENWRGAIGIGGFDGSQTTDLTNFKVLFMRPGDPTKYIFSHYWIPEAKLVDSDDRAAGAEYQKWADEGFITIVPGAIIDQAYVVEYVESLFAEFGITLFKVGYDKNYAREFEKGMRALKDDILEVINTKLMSLPMKWLERDLDHHLVNFSNNPVDTWCLKNAGCKIDNKENYSCVKFSKPKRIDGAIVMIILYAVLIQHQREYFQQIER